jgi:hypothetical protein
MILFELILVAERLFAPQLHSVGRYDRLGQLDKSILARS